MYPDKVIDERVAALSNHLRTRIRVALALRDKSARQASIEAGLPGHTMYRAGGTGIISMRSLAIASMVLQVPEAVLMGTEDLGAWCSANPLKEAA